jgi:hypothetical protein
LVGNRACGAESGLTPPLAALCVTDQLPRLRGVKKFQKFFFAARSAFLRDSFMSARPATARQLLFTSSRAAMG